jgi:hypothetical protein
MSMTIELPDSLWEELAREAKREGVSPDEYAALLLQWVTSIFKQARDAEAHGKDVDPGAAALAAAYELIRRRETCLVRAEGPGQNLVTRQAETTTEQARDPERVARVRSVRGRFAHGRPMLGSEELHRERQVDKEKEERLVRGQQT